MLSFVICLVTAICGISAYDYDGHYRSPRGSAGAFSGVSNGQFYGGSYHAPDNGPAVFNRFGDAPPGAFSAASGGAPGFAPFVSPFAFAPGVPPFPSPFEFNQFFQSYFSALNDNLAIPRPRSRFRRPPPLTSSSSSSSISFTQPAKPFRHRAFAKNYSNQKAAYDAAQKAFQSAGVSSRFGPAPGYRPNTGSSYSGASSGGYSGGGSGSYSGGGSGSYSGSKPSSYSGGAAAASSSFGPGGGYQSAHVYPENPSKPNVETRFGSSGPKPGGSYGVSSSSFSSSADVNGKRVNHKQASTTVNDNGKVTTYTVRD